jgi:NAD(P)H-dependent FMN reductase
VKKLLIIAHCPSPNTQRLADALQEGALDPDIDEVEVTLSSPFECETETVLECDALILFTTENFGYMSGALKDFFERVYYPCLEQERRNEAKPFALVVRAGLDGTGTDIAVHKITSGLKWREIHETLVCKGDFQDGFLEQCRTLGLTVAAGLDNQIF